MATPSKPGGKEEEAVAIPENLSLSLPLSLPLSQNPQTKSHKPPRYPSVHHLHNPRQFLASLIIIIIILILFLPFFLSPRHGSSLVALVLHLSTAWPHCSQFALPADLASHRPKHSRSTQGLQRERRDLGGAELGFAWSAAQRGPGHYFQVHPPLYSAPHANLRWGLSCIQLRVILH
jgi:hypothetical protein